jgi:rhodanese-related sulfurtransferase
MRTLALTLLTTTFVFLSSCNSRLNNSSLGTFESAEEMVEAAMTGVDSITPNDFKTMLDAMEYFYLIDVRSEDEYASGYIPGAVSIPRGVLEFRIADEAIWDKEGLYSPTKEDMIILYCKKGQRSVLAAQTLHQLGYDSVRFLTGGWLKWNALYPEIQEKLKATSTVQGAPAAAASSGGC